MRRHRRLVLIDRVIPFLAAFVGLVALAGSVVVQMNAEATTRLLTEEMTRTRLTLDLLSQRTEALAVPVDDGTVEGLLALQDRMVKLETELQAQAEAAAAAQQSALLPGAATEGATAAIDPELPTTDCIPLGTRFMVTPNENYPLCQSSATVKVGFISGDSVTVDGAGQIVETGFGKLAGTSCTVMVFSADAEGFAELRVTCT